MLGISPLANQQHSGYLAKPGTFGVLLTVAYVLSMRTDAIEEHEDGALHWIDAQRQLERAARSDRRTEADPTSP